MGSKSIVLGALLSGVAVGTRTAENRQELEQLLASERVHQLVIDATTAAQDAGVYRERRRRGRAMPTNDRWIAASALQHGFVVCSIVWPQFLALAAVGGTFFGIANARFRSTIGTMA
jgi:predicted nucleic acid-binding protein